MPHTTKQLLTLIQKLEKYFQIYPHKEHKKELATLKQLLKNQTCNIAIVANMSAGKSTFINALFGEVILPASSEATTDCATYIRPSTNKQAIITFENNQTLKLQEHKIKSEIKKYAQKDDETTETKYKNVAQIQLNYPFKHIQNLQDSHQTIFIDNPGPNNTSTHAHKHKLQSTKALEQAHVVFFMFNYEQIDANLADDGQNLWHTIKEHRTKDKNLEIFFIIHKIDAIFNSSDSLEKGDEHKQWNLCIAKRDEAIKKLKDAASKHGIKNAKVFCVSSYYALLYRIQQDALTNSSKDKLANFMTLHPQNLEAPMLDLMGIEAIENAINTYIKYKAQNKLVKNIQKQILRIINREWIAAQKDTAKNTQDSAMPPRVTEFFSKLTHTMHQKSEVIRQITLDEIAQILPPSFTPQEIEEIARNAFFFLRRYAESGDIETAIRVAIAPTITMFRSILPTLGSITAKDAQTEQNYRDALQHYLKKRTKIFQDEATSLHNLYKHCYIRHTQLLHQAQEQITNQLSQTLGIKIDSTPPQFEPQHRMAHDHADTLRLPHLWVTSKHVSYEQLHKSIKSLISKRSRNFQVAKDTYQYQTKKLCVAFSQHLIDTITYYQHQIQKQDEKLNKVKSTALSQILFDFLLES